VAFAPVIGSSRGALGARVALGCAILLAVSRASPGQAGPRTLVARTPHFAFYNDFETNLNDALVAAGLARGKGRPELFHSDADAPCFDKQPEAHRAAWDGAVDYYAKIISPAGWSARPQFLIRVRLVGFHAEEEDAAAADFVEIARAFRAAAAPAYRACRWTAQGEKNRRWISALEPKLAADEEAMADRLAGLYQKQWRVLPILVDAVETVDWSGANTAWSDTGQGDVLISSAIPDASAFETLFHEASHLLMDRGDPVRLALDKAAKAASYRPPDDLWHVVLFYTTGEAVRRLFDGRGQSAYTPMLYEIFDRGSWTQYRGPLEKSWRPYVEGKRKLGEAAARLVADLRKAERR
jgi:hypothetical protein